jgi:hypothetical protein
MIIANKRNERRREYVDEIVASKPNLQFNVQELCEKYKTKLD